MNKTIAFGIGAIVLLVLVVILWPSSTPKAGPDTPPGQMIKPIGDAKSFANAEEFYQALQSYLRGSATDQGRIQKSASEHSNWVEQLFPEKRTDFSDAMRLTMGKYRILYPYLTPALIDSYHLITMEVTNDDTTSVDILIKRGGNPNQEFILTAATSAKMIDLLIKDGADPNLPDSTGERPVKRFRRSGRPDLIEAMQRNGARD